MRAAKEVLSMRQLVTESTAFEKMRTVLDRAIDRRLRIMRKEADVLINDLEVAIHRISKDGTATYVGDIKTAAWFKASTELGMLQRTRRALEDVIQGKEPADNLFEELLSIAPEEDDE